MDTPSRALVVGAHPDDADVGTGGLIALWSSLGCEVTVACVTDGDSGGFDADVPREQVPEIRRDEQRAAAELLGAKESAAEHGLPAGRLAEAYRVLDTA